MKITMEHGSGGLATGQLIKEVFEDAFDNKVLSEMEDSAVVPGSSRIAVTTDSFVVTPLEYPGGDIGRLCICGTVNDLLMRGAVPKYITCGFILQEGADVDQLKRVVKSMADTAKEAGVTIVAGDTKVVEGEGGIMVNTAGVGFVAEGVDLSSSKCEQGDVVIASGTLGEHHEIKVFKLPAAAVPKAQVLKNPVGILKAIVDVKTKQILGASLFCEESYEMINTVKLAMDAGLSYEVLRDQVFTHPTMSEALNDLFAG